MEHLLSAHILTVPLLWVMKGLYIGFGSAQQKVDMHARSKNTFIVLKYAYFYAHNSHACILFLCTTVQDRVCLKNTFLLQLQNHTTLLASQMKQIQPSTGECRSHKAQHLLESFERTGGAFLEGSRVVLNLHGSLRWDGCCHLHWVYNCAQEWYSVGWVTVRDATIIDCVGTIIVWGIITVSWL